MSPAVPHPDQPPARLLVVDFDFFFPNPHDAGASDTRSLRLYDWGHAETRIHREVIWPARAAAFTFEGVPLPRCEPTDGFWARFTFDTDLLLVADSNAYAGPLAWEGEYAKVVLFDAHHDSGYRHGYADYLTTGQFTCEDWTYPHHEAGAAITVRYPRWRHEWRRLEPTTGIPVNRCTDDGGPLTGMFTTVFACRSGGWVPPWCDDQCSSSSTPSPAPWSASILIYGPVGATSAQTQRAPCHAPGNPFRDGPAHSRTGHKVVVKGTSLNLNPIAEP